MRLCYDQKSGAADGLRYVRAPEFSEDGSEGGSENLSTASLNMNVLDSHVMGQFTQLSFPTDSTWMPKRIEINGRKGRQAICVLASDEKSYRIYDMENLREVDEPEVSRLDEK